jgi:hypothetical protein
MSISCFSPQTALAPVVDTTRGPVQRHQAEAEAFEEDIEVRTGNC